MHLFFGGILYRFLPNNPVAIKDILKTIQIVPKLQEMIALSR